jgi:hypothetical protein
VFRLGVELPETYRTKLQRHDTISEIEECTALHELPGFVSDMDGGKARPQRQVLPVDFAVEAALYSLSTGERQGFCEVGCVHSRF